MTRPSAALLSVILMLTACGQREGGERSAPPATSDAIASDTGTVAADADPDLEAALPEVEPIEPPSELTVPGAEAMPSQPTTTDAATTPGTYTYAVTGTVNGETVLGVSSLTVSDPEGDGRQSHIEKTPGGATITVYRMASEGRYLDSITIVAGSRTISLRPDQSLLLVPAGAVGGVTTGGRMSGDDAVAEIAFTLVELDAERMIVQISTRLVARIGPACLLTGTIATTAATRTADQLPLDVRAESELETSGPETCAGSNRSQTRSLLTG